jgi:hypothetical protein
MGTSSFALRPPDAYREDQEADDPVTTGVELVAQRY